MMSEIYVFNADDELLTILSEDNGLVSAPFKEEINKVPDSPLTIIVDAEAEYEQTYDGNHNLTQVAGAFVGRVARSGVHAENVVAAKYIQEENRVVFRDRENKLREYVIKEVDDVSNIDAAEVTAICFPAWIDELNDNYVLDKRYSDKEAQEALNDALEGTRYDGEVTVSLGKASTSFYKLTSTECVFKIIDTWGGDLVDEIELNDLGRIDKRKLIISNRIGSDKGLWFEVGHNTQEIKRTVLSYPKTALYGWGASLQIEDEEGEHTGGYTRYIDFGDVEWKVSNGDPVDKPRGQKWVGNNAALQKYGRKKKDGTLLHRRGEFNDQNIEDPEELLLATYNHLMESASKVEVNYQLSVHLLSKTAELGDTAVAKDYSFAKPITIQTRIISIEYDLLDKDDAVVEMGQFLDLEDDRISDIEDTLDNNRGKWEHPQIENENFPDRKPNTPINVDAFGGINIIQVYWDYDYAVYISHYEVYGSKVKDFTPDSQHLLWRGRVSAFAHEVDDSDTWYYRVRAVNTRGTASDWSKQVSAKVAMNIKDELQGALDSAADAMGRADEAFGVAGKAFDEARAAFDEIGALSEFVGEHEGEISTIKHDLLGLQTTVGDMEGNLTEVTQIATGLQTTVEDIEGNLTEVTQISKGLQMRVSDLSAKNLITHDPENWMSIVASHWTYDMFSLEGEKTYTVTDFSSQRINELQISLYNGNREHVRNIVITNGQSRTFTTASNEVYAMVFVEVDDYFLEKLGTTYKFKLAAGEESTSWTNHDEDLYSQYTQLSDAINLRVMKNDVLNEINISTEGILINGSKLWITAQTIIDSGVIGRAQIADLAVDNAKIANTTITSAKIASLSVDKLTGSVANFVRTGFNNVTSQVSITGSGMETYSGGERTSLINGSGQRFYRDNRSVGHIGTSNFVNDSGYRGLRFGLENDADYMSWGYKQTAGASSYTTLLTWHRTSAKDEKGFNFSDRVVFKDEIQVTEITTYFGSTRRARVNDFTWDGVTGFAIYRYASSKRGGTLILGTSRAALISSGNAHIEVLQDSEGNVVRSLDVYNRRYSSAANMHVTSYGTFGMSTSARKYKRDIEAIEKEYAYNFFENATPVFYRPKNTADDNKEHSHYGYIADDVAPIEPRLVQFDQDNNPSSFSYDRVPVLLHVVMKNEKQRVDTMEKQLNNTDEKVCVLELKVQILEQEVKQLKEMGA